MPGDGPALVGKQGPAGPPGTAGTGSVFTTTSGSTGPTISAAGSYLVAVNGLVTNQANTPLIGDCLILALSGNNVAMAHAVNAAFQAMPQIGEVIGLSVVYPAQQSDVGSPLMLNCQDESGQPVSVTGVQWYVTPIATKAGTQV